MQRNPSLAVPLAPGHLRPAEAPREGDPDALGAGAHGPEDGLLHGPPVTDPTFDLGRDVLRHELGVQLRLLDLLDGDAYAVSELLLEVLARGSNRAQGLPLEDEPADLIAEGLDGRKLDDGCVHFHV